MHIETSQDVLAVDVLPGARSAIRLQDIHRSGRDPLMERQHLPRWGEIQVYEQQPGVEIAPALHRSDTGDLNTPTLQAGAPPGVPR